MTRRPHRWTKIAVLLWPVWSGCGGIVDRPTADAAVDREGTTDGPAGSRDSTNDSAPPMRDATVDRRVPSEAAANDGGALDATTTALDTGVDVVDVEVEASCAVDAGPLDDAEVKLGESIVMAHRCTTCHGGTLSGNFDGVPSPTLEGGRAYPPNLTSDPATGLGCWTNDQIENAFLNGIDNEGTPLCPPMPRFGHLTDGGALDAAQAQAIVQFLRSLPIFVNQVPNTPDCPMSEAGVPDDGGPPIEAGLDASDEGAAVGTIDGGD